MRGKPAGSTVTIRLIINRGARDVQPEDILEADKTGLMYFVEDVRKGPKLFTIRATKLDHETFAGPVDWIMRSQPQDRTGGHHHRHR
jgi:hypothetical protein